MIDTEERVSLLEHLMEQVLVAQRNTEISLDRLSREMREFKTEMREFKTEMREFKDECERDRKRMNKAWGDLANKLGTIVEDIAAPNIRRMATEEFGMSAVEDFYMLATRASRRGPARSTEFDVLCAGGTVVILGEMKSTASIAAVESFALKKAEFFDFYPEYDGRNLLGVFASWSLSVPVVQKISECGLYGIAMGDETMQIVARPKRAM